MSAASDTAAFLLAEIPAKRRWRHAFEFPGAPVHAIELMPAEAQRRLQAIHAMLTPCVGKLNWPPKNGRHEVW
jgi:hypothetical protein